jgi:hypothetical protein
MIAIISAACGNTDDTAGVQADTQAAKEVQSFQETDTPAEGVSDDQIDDQIDEKDKEASEAVEMTGTDSLKDWSEYEVLVDLAMQRGFGENFKVNLEPENKKMSISVWVDGAADASTVVATGNPDAIAAWSKMKNNIVTLSQDMYDRLDDKGIGKEGAEITIDFLNDNDLNKSLIVCTNGECVYDCTE